MFLKVADVRERCLPILFGLTTALGAFPLFITFESRRVPSAFMEMQFTDPPFFILFSHYVTFSPSHPHGITMGTRIRAVRAGLDPFLPPFTLLLPAPSISHFGTALMEK